jgi:hypothetical protein
MVSGGTGQIDKKITGSFADVYEILHLSMGYDGVQNAKVIIIGLHEAENIINWTEQKNGKNGRLNLAQTQKSSFQNLTSFF